MEIQTDIATQDLVDFNLYHQAHSTHAKRQRSCLILFGLILSGPWLVLSALSRDPAKTFTIFIPMILPGLIFIILVLLSWRWMIKRQVRKYLAEGKNKGILGPQKVVLSTNGVEDISETSQTSTSWKAVERVVANEDCLYIYVSAISAVIVPKRSFSTEDDFESFTKAAKEYYVEATGLQT